jgi:hypothetical protein
LRRFERGWEHFEHTYRALADECGIRQFGWFTSVTGALAMSKPARRKKTESFAAGVGRGLCLAAKAAREVARMHGTPIYVWENGKVVAKKPWSVVDDCRSAGNAPNSDWVCRNCAVVGLGTGLASAASSW